MTAVRKNLWRAYCLCSLMLAVAACEERTDNCPLQPRFAALPPGWRVERTSVVAENRRSELARHFGIPIEGLDNVHLTANGRRLQVNTFRTASPQDAARLHDVISPEKKDPAFCIVSGPDVVEFVVDEFTGADLAIKAAFELGFRPKPTRVHYRVTARLAPVEEADYMNLNQIFNLFLDKANPSRDDDIREASQSLRFGNRLVLCSGVRCQFDPAPVSTTECDGVRVYEFACLPRDHDVPYAQVTADIEASAERETDLSAPSGKSCLSSTAFWPASDPEIKALAEDIGKGLASPKGKVDAFLEWLAPGKNIAFGGPVTGSRWGVAKVISQRFGCCWDFSDCFITMCRAVGIPARQIGGWFYGMEGHIWAEVFCGDGWKQVDPTGGGRLDCGIYHIPYFRSDTGAMPVLYLDRPRISVVAAGNDLPAPL